MDIGRNLSYNENTVHSGNFLENRTGFGKETMRYTIRNKITENTERDTDGRKRRICRSLHVFVLFIGITLCGCTRREQLVLEDVSTEQMQRSPQQQLGGQLEISEQNEAKQPILGESELPQSAQNSKPQTIYVHVCGAVEKPDVYELPADSRVYEAVQAAGGFTEEADLDYVNQAQKLLDGVKLVIPTMQQTEAISMGNEGELTVGIVSTEGIPSVSQGGDDGMGLSDISDGKININTASETELCSIPGIGAVRAAAIVAYRREKGTFTSIEDIKNVSGIKEGTYEKIKDSIKID